MSDKVVDTEAALVDLWHAWERAVTNDQIDKAREFREMFLGLLQIHRQTGRAFNLL